MCDCIEKAEKLIREKVGDPEACIHVTFAIQDLAQKPAGMHAVYREKKKDGQFKERESRIGIVPTYCPFCGINYDTKESSNV